MEFHQVKYFLAVCRTLNFTQAARECHVSQPALTKAIKKLEDELGGALLVRSRSGASLTSLGDIMREHLWRIEETRRKAKAAAHAAVHDEMRVLNIGVMCTISASRIARLLAAFELETTGVRIVLHDMTRLALDSLMRSNMIDVAFVAVHRHPFKATRQVALYHEAMAVSFATGHAFGERDAVPLDEVARERYVDRLGCEFREALQAFSRERAIDLNVVASTEREDWTQDLVQAGLGVATVPQFMPILPGVETRPVCEPELSRSVSLAAESETGSDADVDRLFAMAEDFDWSVQQIR